MTLAEKIEEVLKDELAHENIKTVIELAEFFKYKEKEKFTLGMQGEDVQTIETDVRYNNELSQMFIVSEEEYNKGLGVTTQELLSTLSEKDFR